MSEQPIRGGNRQPVDAAGAGSSSAPQPCYQIYHPLWHLQRIGWTVTGGPQTRVALIDTGVCLDHPYLAERIDRERSIDFGAAAYGLSSFQSRTPRQLTFDANLLSRLGLGRHQRVVADILRDANGRLITFAQRTTLEDSFASHGTACAGLVVGLVPLQDESGRPPNQGTPAPAPPLPPLPVTPGALFYFGVDPCSSLFSIGTSLDPTPEQLILAVLYAFQNEADVILLPRGLATDWHGKPDAYDNPGGTLPDLWDRPAWAALEALLLAVSEEIPVVCAAGNSGEPELAYPAKLSAQAGSNGIIAVGAATYLHRRSSYSNYGEGLTLVAPSDDAEVLNRHQARLDKCSRRYRLHEYAAYEGTAADVPYSYQSILALDVPGGAGYAGGGQTGVDEDDPVNAWFDPTLGAFALFGGTSAASSIVGGVAAQVVRLAKQKGRPLKGPEVKRILEESAVLTGRDAAEADWRLEPDDMNGDLPTDRPEALALLFGRGLVNLKRALAAVENRP